MQISVSRVGIPLCFGVKSSNLDKNLISVPSVIGQWGCNFMNQAVKVPGVCEYAAKQLQLRIQIARMSKRIVCAHSVQHKNPQTIQKGTVEC